MRDAAIAERTLPPKANLFLSIRSLGLLENLIEAAFKQLHVPDVGNRIKNGLVLPTRLEQPEGFKLRKLLGDGGNRDFQNLSEIADAKPLNSVKRNTILSRVLLPPLGIATFINIHEARERLLASTEALLTARGDQLVRELDTFNRGYQRSVDMAAHLPNVVGLCEAHGVDIDRLKPGRPHRFGGMAGQ